MDGGPAWRVRGGRLRLDRPRLMLVPTGDTLDLEGTVRARP